MPANMGDVRPARTAVRWVHIPSHHPAFPGHFPGRPIVPGVVLLDYVEEFVREIHAGMSVREIPVAKFLRSVMPDDTVLITLEYPQPEDAADNQLLVRFACRVGRELAAQGSLRVSPR